MVCGQKEEITNPDWSQVAPFWNHKKIHARPGEEKPGETEAYIEAAEPELRELRAGANESCTSSASSSLSSGSSSGKATPPAHSVDFSSTEWLFSQGKKGHLHHLELGELKCGSKLTRRLHHDI
jgi:hypothetical protein